MIIIHFTLFFNTRYNVNGIAPFKHDTGCLLFGTTPFTKKVRYEKNDLNSEF